MINSDNFNNTKIEAERDINIHIGNSNIPSSILPKIVFSHQTFVEVLNDIDEELTTNELLDNQKELVRADMIEKNKLNAVDQSYFEQIMCEDLKENFDEITEILTSKRWILLQKKYYRVAKDLNRNYMADRISFPSIQKHIESVIEVMYTKHEKKLDDCGVHMVSLILYHMYFRCIYGEKPR